VGTVQVKSFPFARPSMCLQSRYALRIFETESKLPILATLLLEADFRSLLTAAKFSGTIFSKNHL